MCKRPSILEALRSYNMRAEKLLEKDNLGGCFGVGSRAQATCINTRDGGQKLWCWMGCSWTDSTVKMQQNGVLDVRVNCFALWAVSKEVTEKFSINCRSWNEIERRMTEQVRREGFEGRGVGKRASGLAQWAASSEQ